MGILGLLFGGGTPSRFEMVIENKDTPMREGNFNIYYCKDQNGSRNKIGFDGTTMYINDKLNGVVVSSKPDGRCMTYIIKEEESGRNWRWMICAGRIWLSLLR